MNYIEALQALVDGKKIRHKSWGKDIYRFIGADDKFCNDLNAQTSFMIYNKNEILSDSWELYKTEEEKLIQAGKRWGLYMSCDGCKSCLNCEEKHELLYKLCSQDGRVTALQAIKNLPDDEVDKLYNAVKGEIDA